MYIDTHCHLDSKDYSSNVEDIIYSAMDLGVNKFIIPGADIDTLYLAIKLSDKFDSVYFACGIHPNEASKLNEKTKIILESNLCNPKCVAVGEIGLDYHYLESLDIRNLSLEKQLQEKVFRWQVELAIKLNKPIIIHTRDSNIDLVNILKDYQNDIISLVFHCFSGDSFLINSLQCPIYYGIGGIVTFKNAKELKSNIYKLPLDSIVLETDSPFLAPTPYRGQLNTPEYIPIINSNLSSLLNLSIDDMANITTNNASRLFFGSLK